MKKQSLVMISSKVLAEMLAYRKHFPQCFTDYPQALKTIKKHIDSIELTINSGCELDIIAEVPFAQKMYLDNLISIAARCLLTISECRSEHLLYNQVFDKLFETINAMEEEFIEKGTQFYDEAIVKLFNDFQDLLKENYSTHTLNIYNHRLYQIVVYCVFLYNYLNVNTNPIVEVAS